MKLDIFTWIPASSAGMTILLFAAQLNAAGVCIICPPGHTCVAGSGPVLGGAEGQLLRRTAMGTEWVNASAMQGPAGPTGAQGPQGAPGAQGNVGPQGPAGAPPANLVPTSRTIANVPLTGNISRTRLISEMFPGRLGNATCSTSSTQLIPGTGYYCWCGWVATAPVQVPGIVDPATARLAYSSQVFQQRVSAGYRCSPYSVTGRMLCGLICSSNTGWQSRITW